MAEAEAAAESAPTPRLPADFELPPEFKDLMPPGQP
jgi:hypothetical protein